MSAVAAPFVCPGCGSESIKSVKGGHCYKCKCRSCTGKRNQAKGKRAQANMHRALGGTSFTPSHEESARPYTAEIVVMPESKHGQQVPASFTKLVRGDWFRRALSQSERALPVGSPNLLPAVYLEPEGGGKWLIVRLR